MTRVLLADDSSEVRTLLRAGLEAAGGISVVGEAADGAEAVAAVDAIRPDVVVLDVAMPVMDGLEALAEIRRRHGAAVPVVMWSGFSSEHLADRALSGGAVAYVEKSGDLAGLIMVLRRSTIPDGTSERTAAHRLGAAARAPQTPPATTAVVLESGTPDTAPEGEQAVGTIASRSELRRVASVWPWSLRSAVLLAGVMYAVVAAVRAAVGDPTVAVAVLYILPISVLSLAGGVRAGSAGAAVATALWLAYSLPAGIPLAHSTTRLAAFWFVGLVMGYLTGRANAALRDNRRDRAALAAANRRLSKSGEKLAATNVQLEESVADLRQFTHVASHDLAEPLRTMGGFAHLVESRYGAALDETGRQFLTHIVDGAARMQALIDDLRAYTVAGQQELRSDTVELDRVLDLVRANLHATLTERGAVLMVDPLPVVPGDATMLTLVFQNLVANGVKFNTADPPTVEVRGRAEGDRVVVEVVDNGIGIPREHLERVFQLFQRLHTRDDYPGTGLGLAICQRIVARHAGTLTLRSDPGHGSTAVVSLPGRAA